MADLDSLLEKTSRTFALAIPVLPEPTRREVRVAYLLFRIADTFEDATRWTPGERMRALEILRSLLEPGRAIEAEQFARYWQARPPLEHDGYIELLGETATVLRELGSTRREARAIVRRHVDRTAEGMTRFAGRSGALVLRTIDELRSYCYVVAGIVGEMLTELFLLGREDLSSIGPDLRERARFFGEGLQLTNILKDAAGDLEEGRSYVPHEASRPEIFVIAREDLRLAGEYVRALEAAAAPRGILAFVATPVLLAWSTLDRVERQGPGAKLTRVEVAEMLGRMHYAIERGDRVPLSVAPLRAPEEDRLG